MEQLKIREQSVSNPTTESGYSEQVSDLNLGCSLSEAKTAWLSDGSSYPVHVDKVFPSHYVIDGIRYSTDTLPFPCGMEGREEYRVVALKGESKTVTPIQSGGVKYDSGKPRMDLLVPEADELTAMVFGFGGGKYGDYNWAKGINYSRLHAALRRHVSAWARGVDLDDESGLPHLAHARCCIDMLLYFHATERSELDDRPSKLETTK